MKRLWLVVLLLAALAAGCSGGIPQATTGETSVDFGDVPTITDMRLAKVAEFTIGNEGVGRLKLSGIEVKTLEGCWPPDVTVGSTVVKPGESTTLQFPYAMHPGMEGPHLFEIHVKTNDPKTPKLVFEVRANSVPQ